MERVLKAAGLEDKHSTKKVVEYGTRGGKHVLYFRTEIGLPSYLIRHEPQHSPEWLTL